MRVSSPRLALRLVGRLVARASALLLAAFALTLLAAPGTATEVDVPLPRYEPGEAGSGRLVSAGPPDAPAIDCPLEHTDVRVSVSGFVARVHVTQRFRNPSPDAIEAVYTFPLSDRGAVDAMWMRTGGREIRGEIHRREEARRIYDDARAAGQVAALLDQERPNIFTQSVANVMPGATVEIEIHYVETLRFEAGTFSFAFPTVVGPRFIPGVPRDHSPRGTGWSPDTGRVPDASRITPPVAPEGTRAGHDIAIEVALDAGVPILGLEAPLHRVDVERDGTDRAQVRLSRLGAIPNRDFVLRWTVATDQVTSGALAHRMPGEEGFVSLVLLPPERVEPTRAVPKELVFVIDRSGSQRGLPLAKAKETMLWILDHMHPQDTFQVIDFGSTANRLFDRPRLAGPGMKARARAYVEALEANGGTLMAEAIREVAATPAEGGRLRVVAFMTDGYIGNDHEVLSLVREVRGTSRWFPFGTGNSVNRYLIEGMAREGGGEPEFVLLGEPGERVAERFWQRIASPVLTDVRVHFEGGGVHDVFPREPSDLWAERPLVFHARYARAGRMRVVVEGRHAGGPYREVMEVDLPRRARDHDALGSLWARAQVQTLLRRDLRALGNGTFPQAVREAVVEIALAHRLVTPFTSFVAVEDRVVNDGGQTRTVPVPVEMPQGVTHEGVFGSDQRVGRASRAQAKYALGVGSQVMSAAPAPVMAEAHREMEVDRPRSVPTEADADHPTEPGRGHASQSTLARLSALDPAVRARLSPGVVALLENGATAVPMAERRDGRVRIRVAARRVDPTLRRALEAAGLEITLSSDEGWLEGWAEATDLIDVAGVEGVERVEVAGEA